MKIFSSGLPLALGALALLVGAGEARRKGGGSCSLRVPRPGLSDVSGTIYPYQAARLRAHGRTPSAIMSSRDAQAWMDQLGIE